MAIHPSDLDQLAARLGRENVLASEADRHVYSTDIGSPPFVVDLLLLGHRKADAVARCRTIEDVATVVRFCRKRNIPMTPRAAATNALGGAVPKRGGIVLDLTPMNKHLVIDEERMMVTVDAGVPVWQLQEKLLEVGLELPCYPTSGLAATIGGFVAMDGHGIHATRAGNIGRWVEELEVVGADGNVDRVRDDIERAFHIGLGGSTGVICRVRLRVVEATVDKPVMVALRSTRDAQALMEECTKRFSPKHVMFRNRDFFAMRKEATGDKDPAKGRDVVFLVFPEPAWSGIEDDVRRMVERHHGEVLDKPAGEEWGQRMYPIKDKRNGPSLIAGEVFVPLERFHAYLNRLRDKTWVDDLSVEGHVTDDGRVYFFIHALDDERRPNYPAGWGTSARVLTLAKRYGGRAYHSGVWLQWESKSVFGTQQYKHLKTLKNQADPSNLMNPGMVFPLAAPFPERLRWLERAAPMPIAPSLGFQLAAGNPILQSTGGAVKHRVRKTTGVKAVDVATDSARALGLGLHTDLIWGCDLTSLQALPNPGDLPMTQTPRGKMALVKAYVRGKIRDPWAFKEALDVADPPVEDCKATAPEYPEVVEVLDAFRRAIQDEGVELEVKAVEVEEAEEAPVEAKPAAGKEEGGLDIEAIKKKAAETPEEEKAWVLAADCIVCNGCESACPTDAAIVTDMARVDRDLCIADGACFDACPTDAIRPGIEDEEKSAGWPEGSRLAGKFGV